MSLEDNKRKVLSYVYDVLDCHNSELIREGDKIAEEWIIRDELKIALQAGDATAAAGV